MNPQSASWGRVATGTVALFAVILAFLAGKVVSGSDPNQAKASAPAPVITEQPEPGPVTTQQS